MIRNDWNALQVGHHVMVHDESDPTMGLTPGRVTQVDPAPGSNEVTIRIASRKGPSRVVQPRRLAVHLDTGEPTERCWRCETHYAAAAAGG
jgi:hypothetical protein